MFEFLQPNESYQTSPLHPNLFFLMILKYPQQTQYKGLNSIPALYELIAT